MLFNIISCAFLVLTIRTAKRSSWRSFCSDIEKTADVARLRTVLSTIPCLIKSEAGHWTDSNLGSLNLLLETHFAGCSEVDNIKPGTTMVDATDAGIVTTRKLEWAVGSSEQYKSSGPDGIFPAMLQKAVYLIIPWLKKVLETEQRTGSLEDCKCCVHSESR